MAHAEALQTLEPGAGATAKLPIWHPVATSWGAIASVAGTTRATRLPN